jgi:hypothetical protein
MAGSRLFVGTRVGSQLAETGIGYADIAIPYTLLAKSDKVAPAGPAGECIFTSLYLTIAHFATIRLLVTPIVDEVPEPTQEITLVGLDPVGGPYTEENRAVEVVEVGLSKAFLVDGVERLRTYPRGTWFEVLVESEVGTMQRIDAMELEHEVVVAPAKPVGVVV